MNKRVIMIFTVIGMAIGGYVPILLGWDQTGLNGISIIGALIGGVGAILLVIKLASR